jgi:hypothetical protein
MVLQMNAAAVMTATRVGAGDTCKLEMLQQQGAAADYDGQRSAVQP